MTEEIIKSTEQQLITHRIYVKELSLLTTDTPQVFNNVAAGENWNPEVKIDLQVEHTALEDNYFDVAIKFDVLARPKQDTELFHIKVTQAGVFEIAGFDSNETDYLLTTYCPEMLFPFANEIITNLVTHAGFPQLNLLPVNFKALYEQQQADKTE